MSVDSNNIRWNHWELSTLDLHLAEGQSCADMTDRLLQFAQTHMQIWHKSAKCSLHILAGGKNNLFPEWQKPSADKMSPVTRLVPVCCRDGRFTSRMFWIPICTRQDLLQYHLFQCGCHPILAGPYSTRSSAELQLNLQNPFTPGRIPRAQSWYYHAIT